MVVLFFITKKGITILHLDMRYKIAMSKIVEI